MDKKTVRMKLAITTFACVCAQSHVPCSTPAHYMDVESSSWTTSIDMQPSSIGNPLINDAGIAYNIIRFI